MKIENKYQRYKQETKGKRKELKENKDDIVEKKNIKTCAKACVSMCTHSLRVLYTDCHCSKILFSRAFNCVIIIFYTDSNFVLY